MNDRSKENLGIDVIGIGNAIVDVIIQCDDSSLKKYSLTKGSMTLVDESQAEELYKNFNQGKKISGGSVANSLDCIAQLGGKSAFIGRVKNDNLGEIFRKQILKSGTIYETTPSKTGPSTARCMIFVTPDAQRTMCTYLGASTFLDSKDIDLSLIKNAKILYLEGYLWDDESAKKAFIAAAEVAKSSGKRVALSLSDSFCVNRHRRSFLELLNNYIDILFANEDEITSLYQTENLESAINQVKGRCELAIVTCGEKGSLLIEKESIKKISAYNLGEVIDTTGAGDLFAGGFLKGFTNGLNPFQAAQLGSMCAGFIVTKLGPRSEEPLKKIIGIMQGKNNLNP